MLKCKRTDYKEGEKNVWYVEMPEFVNHQSIRKPINKNDKSEMDEDYHDKFRTSQAKESEQKNN